MLSPLIFIVYIIGVCFFLLLQVLIYVRNGESANRVRMLWLTPIIILPFALYFCLFAVHSVWVFLAAAISLIGGAVLEWIHVDSAQVIPDMQHRTLHLEGSSRIVLLLLMLVDAIGYAMLLMAILSFVPVLHTSFFSQFGPELVPFSLGSRGVRALLLSQFWKKAQRHHHHGYSMQQGLRPTPSSDNRGSSEDPCTLSSGNPRARG
jgi:hypothetical protein